MEWIVSNRSYVPLQMEISWTRLHAKYSGRSGIEASFFPLSPRKCLSCPNLVCQIYTMFSKGDTRAALFSVDSQHQTPTVSPLCIPQQGYCQLQSLGSHRGPTGCSLGTSNSRYSGGVGEIVLMHVDGQSCHFDGISCSYIWLKGRRKRYIFSFTSWGTQAVGGRAGLEVGLAV